MHPSDNPDTGTRLLHSLEMAHYRKQLIIWGIFCLLFAAIAVPGMVPPNSDAYWIQAAIMAAIIVLPVTGFYLLRICQLFRSKEQYIFCKVKLDQPHHSFWTKTMYFTVTLQLPDGSKRTRNTRAIFFAYGIVEPVMENYVNQTVTIGYNPETDIVVVIG